MTINSSAWQTLIINVNLATMTDGANSYGVIENAALAISEGKIAWLGKVSDLPNSLLEVGDKEAAFELID